MNQALMFAELHAGAGLLNHIYGAAYTSTELVDAAMCLEDAGQQGIADIVRGAMVALRVAA